MASVQELLLRIVTVGGPAAAAEVEGVEKATGTLGKTAKSAAGIAGIGGLAFGLKDITENAVKFQAQMAQLTGALKNMGQYSAANVAKVQDAADTLATHGGFDAQTNIGGITRLISAHASVAEAIKGQTLATDIARRSGLSYQTALRAVIQVEQGHTTGLARLGVVLPPVTKAVDALRNAHTSAAAKIALLTAEGVKLTAMQRYQLQQSGKITPAMLAQAKAADTQGSKVQALSELWKRFGGATKDYSNTAAGASSNFKHQIEILGTQLGTILLPIIKTVVHVLSDVAAWLEKNKWAMKLLVTAVGVLGAAWAAAKIAGFVSMLGELAGKLGLATGATTAQAAASDAATGQLALFGAAEEGAAGASGLLAAAMDAIPLLAIVAAIVLVITHWKQVKAVLLVVWDWIKGHWPLLAGILLAPFTLGISLIIALFHKQLLGGIKAAIHWIIGAWHTLEGAVMSVIHFITDHWKLILSILTGPFGAAIIWVASHFGAITHAVGSVFSWIKTAAGHVKDWIIGAFNKVVTFIESLPGKIATIGLTLWDGLKGGLVDVINWIIDRFNGLPLIHGFSIGPIHVPGVPRIAHVSMQAGGIVTQSGLFEVGEQGRETVFLPSGSAVRPHGFDDWARGTTSGGAGPTPMLENHVTVMVGPYQAMKAIAYSQAKVKATR